jgi:AcrR family transcriptional regulator
LLEPTFADNSPRSRLIAGMLLALCEKSFAAVSVADVVRLARVSKRTFYEHFETREACYLASYEAVSGALLTRIEEAAVLDLPVGSRLMAAAEAYLSALQEVPPLARTFFLEIQLAGADALAARRKVHQRFADVLRELVKKGKNAGADVRALSPDMAVAIVGAINELLMVRIEQGRLSELTQLQAAVVELFESLLLHKREPARKRAGARRTASASSGRF